MDAGDARHPRQLLLVYAFEIGDVAGEHLQMIVVAARHQMAGDDIGAARDRSLKRGEIIFALLLQRNGDDDRGDQAKRCRVEIGTVAADDAGVLELADPPRAGGSGEPDLLGEVELACARVTHQLGEDFEVDAIEVVHAAFLHILAV